MRFFAFISFLILLKMSGAPLITMKETKFNNNSRFKTLSDEDLFADEVEPLNSILSKFKYWPRNGSKIYTKRAMLFCGFLLFCIGFLISFLIFGRINFFFKYHSFSSNKSVSIYDVLGLFQRSQTAHLMDFNVSSRRTSYTGYEEAILLKQHFETYKFDEISSIIASDLFLTFKNKETPDALEIVEDKGVICYRNVRNSTYNYIIPYDAKEIRNVTNNVSGLPVYGNFGTQDDFNFLAERGISLRGCIVLLRLGKIPIFEKVTTALKRGANGVLLFADPQQYPNGDLFSVHEEISPTLLADLQKVYSSLGHQSLNTGIPVQIIEAMTAQSILRDMAVINKAPDSWIGSLNALYFIGPGFSHNNWRLVLYSYFLNVNYTTYDIAAHLRGTRENDRYVVLGNKRRTFNANEKTIESTNALMEVSKILAQLKNNDGWNPPRTIVFCSFGLEEAESYSDESWVQTYKHIIKDRAVAYLDLRQPIQGLEYLNVKASPLLQSLFENISSLVENPNAEEKLSEKKSLYDVWHHQQIKYRQQLADNKNHNYTRSKINLKSNNFAAEMVANELFASFGIPAITFGYDTQQDKQSNENTDSIVNIYEYENAIVQLWILLTFSLANDLILPFNISAYSTALNNFHEYVENEINIQNISFADDFKRFGASVKNLTSQIEDFQSNIQMLDDKKLEFRMFNDKLMQIDRLLKCSEDDKFSSKEEIFSSLRNSFDEDDDKIKTALRKATNCISEIKYLITDIKS